MSVEGVQILDLDEIEIGLACAIEKIDDLRMGDSSTLLFADEAGAPVIGAERLFKTVWIHFGAAVRKGEHFEAVAVEGFELLAEFDRISIFQSKKTSTPMSSFFCGVCVLKA